MNRHLKGTLQVLARLVAFAVVLTLVLEASARVYRYGPMGLDPRRIGLFYKFDPNTLIQASENERIGFEHIPNQDRFAKLARFQTNSRGMRDREYGLQKPDNTFRVAVIGSSFALPLGVDIEDAFHSVLEERLSEKYAPRTYEFINFATGAFAPSQMVAMLQDRALAFDPDLIVFCLTGLAVPPMLLRWDKLRQPRFPIWLRVDGPRSVFIDLVQAQLADGGRRPGVPTFEVPEGARDRRNVITKLGQIQAARGIPIVLMRLEYNPELPSELELDIERRARDEGLRYIDTRRAFRGMNPTRFWIDPLDPHPDRDAHAIFANVLEEFLRDQKLVP